MSTPSRARRTLILAAAVAATAVTAAVGVSPAAQADGSSDGTKLVVTVIDSSASPTGTATPTATGSPTATGGATSTASSTSEPTPTPTATGGPGPRNDLGGLLYVSGLSWVYHPSINPFGGALELRFSVRNVYTKAVDASARFWVTQLFGGTVGQSVDVAVTGLKPGESRTVSAAIDGVALWGLVVGHLTFTPPPTLGGTALAPVNRDVLAWFLSWPFIGGVGGAGGIFLWWLLVVRRGLRPGALFGARP